MSKRLVDHTDCELLAELIRRHPPKPGPWRVSWSTRVDEVLVGIGKDHTVSLYMGADDLAALEMELEREKVAVQKGRNE